jgi:hypothetical protein
MFTFYFYYEVNLPVPPNVVNLANGRPLKMNSALCSTAYRKNWKAPLRI